MAHLSAIRCIRHGHAGARRRLAETDRRGIITCKIDRKRKIPITQLLRVFGYKTDADILDLFKN